MTIRAKKWLMFGLAAIVFFALYHTVNLAIFTAWKSAFAGVDVEKLRGWFYFYCGIAIILLIAMILLICKGIKLGKQL
jgi:hypothetical protein